MLVEDVQAFNGQGKPLSEKRKFSYPIESILYPCNEVAQIVVKLFILEGIYLALYSYHCFLLYHFKGLYRVNLTYFPFHSLNIYIRRNKGVVLIHHRLKKILVECDCIRVIRVRCYLKKN